MYRIRLQHDPEHKPKTESFAALDLTVESRSGLHPTEAALLERLTHLGQPCRLLVVGSRTGAAAMAATLHWPECRAHIHVVDTHHARSLRRHVERNGLTERVNVVLAPFVDGWRGQEPGGWSGDASAEPGTRDGNVLRGSVGPPGEVDHDDLPASEPFDAALLQLGHGDEPGELALDWVQEIQLALAPGAKVLVAAEKAAPWLLRAVKDAFHAGPGPVKRQVSVIAGTRRGVPERLKKHDVVSTMTVPGHERALQLVTLPGVFSHRKVDEGAQALAESVPCGADDRVLDMGCGSGAVGLSLAVHRGAGHVTFVDSHARAIWCARENARRNGVTAAEFVLDDEGLQGPPRFTVCAGNPPYFSQHKIDELFLQTARRTLLPEGRVVLVAKNTDWLLPRARELFGDATLGQRRGYGIVTARVEKAATPAPSE